MAALWLDSIGYLAAVLLPLLLGLIVVSPDLIPIVFGSRWEVSVGVVQILSICGDDPRPAVLGLRLHGRVGRPEVTLWTQLASLCLTPVAVVVGVNWGIEGVATCFVISQLITVEIPMFIFVLRQMRVSPRTVAARLSGRRRRLAGHGRSPASLGRPVLESAGVGMAGRAALTIGLGIVVYAIALLARSAPQPPGHSGSPGVACGS